MLLPDYAGCNEYSMLWQNEYENFGISGGYLRKLLLTTLACTASLSAGSSKVGECPHSRRLLKFPTVWASP
jgi:hypothetical protein